MVSCESLRYWFLEPSSPFLTSKKHHIRLEPAFLTVFVLIQCPKYAFKLNCGNSEADGNFAVGPWDGFIAAVISTPRLSDISFNSAIATQSLYDSAMNEVDSGKVTKLSIEIGSTIVVRNFSAGCKLTSLSWTYELPIQSLAFVTPCKSTLTRLTLASPTQNVDELVQFAVLESANLNLNQSTGYELTIPPMLADLQITVGGASNIPSTNIHFSEPSILTSGSSSLNHLRIYGTWGFNIQCLPYNLSTLNLDTGSATSFTLNFSTCFAPRLVPPLSDLTIYAQTLSAPSFIWDKKFSDLERLQSLELRASDGLLYLPTLHPNTAQKTLQSVQIRQIAANQEAVELLLCGIWHLDSEGTPSALSSISFTLEQGPYSLTIPDCFASTHLALSDISLWADTVPADGVAQLISKLPNALTSFSMSYLRPSAVSIPFPWDALMEKASKLQSLVLCKVLTYFAASPIDEVMSKLANISTLTALTLSPGHLNGTLPANLFSLMPQLTSLRLQSNSITGTIPGGNWTNLLEMVLDGNNFVALPVNVTAPKLLDLQLQQNALTTVPDFVTGFPVLQTLSLDYNDHMQLDQLSPGLFATTSELRYFSASSCQLNGSIPAVNAPYLQKLFLSYNNLCGTLPRLLASNPMQHFMANSNFLTGSIHPEYLNRSLNMLELSDNMLSGTLPPVRSAMRVQSAFIWLHGNLDLSGPLPTFDVHPAVSYSTIGLEYTSLSFCEMQEEVSVVFPKARLRSCYFNLTLACNCSVFFNATCADFDARCKTPLSTNLPPTPRESTCPAMPPVAVPESFGCPGTPPSPQFTCVNGSWTFKGNLSINTTLVIPPNSNINITGSLTSNSSIVFNGLGSNITVGGCLSIGKNGSSHVEIELTQDDLETIRRKGGKLTQTLISSDGSCNNLDLVQLNSVVKGSSCRDLKVEKSVSNGQLSALFTVNTSRCNTWWIILASVLASAVVIFCVVMIILVLFVPSVRECLRPYSKRSRTKASITG